MLYGSVAVAVATCSTVCHSVEASKGVRNGHSTPHTAKKKLSYRIGVGQMKYRVEIKYWDEILPSSPGLVCRRWRQRSLPAAGWEVNLVTINREISDHSKALCLTLAELWSMVKHKIAVWTLYLGDSRFISSNVWQLVVHMREVSIEWKELRVATNEPL